MKTNLIIALLLLGSCSAITSCNKRDSTVYLLDLSDTCRDSHYSIVWCDSLKEIRTDKNTDLIHLKYYVDGKEYETYRATGFNYSK